MTHSSEYTNGASLEDCLTNVLALFDLNGIKWRCFCSDSVYVDLLDDPVLTTYSECVSSGVLAAWRRIPCHQKQAGFHASHNNEDASSLKELWIFWTAGEDPDFSRLLKSNLHEGEQGSWETGLSYEGRTLFFKALHNAIERGLLSHGYARFGKYFVVPQKINSADSNKKQKAISFHFFIHGESTVCSSIDVRWMPPVYVLNKCHIAAAQSGHQGIKVILCPYGLSGKLTGNGYKYSDPNMARLLNEWNNFFPHHWKSEQWKMDGEYPHVVEILACGARMKYPTSYVFITEEDHLQAFTTHLPPPQPPLEKQPPPQFHPSLLTPPMSPVHSTTKHHGEESSCSPCAEDCATLLKRSVSQDCCASVPSSEDSSTMLWGFQDPSAVFKCVCSRISKKFKKSLQVDTKIHHPFHRQKESDVPSLGVLQNCVKSESLSSDPAMPTLSPQPPPVVIKEEGPLLSPPSNSNVSASPSSPQGVALKGRISDEVLSPFHASLLNMFENAKNVSKTSPPLQPDAKQCTDTENAGPVLIEKPSLPKRQYEDSDGLRTCPMMGMLYDYQYLNSPLWTCPNSKKNLSRCPENSDVVSDCEECPDSKTTPVPSSVPIQDPYEFTDADEISPSEKGFRSVVESYPKEEEILIPLSLPSPVDNNSPAPEMVRSESSPPDKKNSCPKFIREEDLAVSLHDLENIFDTSSSEEDSAENCFTPAKLPAYDEFSGKIELSRMYPTPPSLEQNAVPSPCYGTSACADCAAANDKDNPEADEKIPTDEDVNVWIPPLIYTFPESPEYSAKDLHFFRALSPELEYKPHRYATLVQPLCEESSEFLNVQPVLEPNGSFYSHDSCSQDFPMSQSSTCDSFGNNSSSVGSHPLEVHPLIINLLLSDSMLNVFKDINFGCCCLCVCNMNIKGSDVGIILPDSITPPGNSEPQYKCTCGFSALVHRHRSYDSGLFYEDEVEIYGADCDTVKRVFGSTDRPRTLSRTSYFSDGVPDFVLDVLKVNSKCMISPFSLFHKCSEMFRERERSSPAVLRSLEYMDGCEVCFAAFEEGKMDNNPLPSKLDESFKSSCLHKWPYISSPARASSSNVLLVLGALRPLLQVAIHRKSMQKMLGVTYVVPAPLTWKEFHRLAPRGTEDQCEPQPIPFTLTCHDGDSAIVSPFSIRHWDKLQLEPYSRPRDVAYIVVAPENESVLCRVKDFFRELGCCYEAHGLGRHRPVTRVLRDGIMRVGRRAAAKVAEEPVAEWFGTLEDGPLTNKLRLYARIFKHRLAPHLSTLPLDRTIFEPSSSSNETTVPSNPSDTAPRLESEPEGSQCPSLVIYVVEPFTFGQHDADLYRLVTLGLLHSYADMLSSLPQATKDWIHLQLISLDSMVSVSGRGAKRTNEMKSLAFSVFSQSHSIVAYQSSVKSLTGFGPTAAHNAFLNKNLGKVPNGMRVYGHPYILASLKDKQTQLGEMFGDGTRDKCSATLHGSYCLSRDKRFIVASCTNDKGDLLETNIINIDIPDRPKRKHTSVLRFGLCKLLEFFLEVMSLSVTPWRLVIERFGRLGQGELKTWASLLSRKSLHSYSRRLRERCDQCHLTGSPCILSLCLVSLEPDSTLQLMPNRVRIVERFGCGSRSKNCHLRTPEDASCTHILVFPTSATTQSSQVTFHQEHIDPLPGGLGEDFFEALNDDDIDNPDISDIFRWGDSPPSTHHQESHSPHLSSSPKHPQEGNQQYPTLISDGGQDEPLQLLQQPLALGYYVSTAKSGNLPKWFWSGHCPQSGDESSVFFKCALLIHLPYVQKTSDELLQTNPQQQLTCHPMDSSFTTDVLRYVLEEHNALSWLALDPAYRDRLSCLPIHIQTLIQLYDILEAIL